MTRGRSFPQMCVAARGTACPPELTRKHQQLAPLLSEPLTGTQPNKSSNALTPGELLTVRSVNPAHPSKKETVVMPEMKAQLTWTVLCHLRQETCEGGT